MVVVGPLVGRAKMQQLKSRYSIVCRRLLAGALAVDRLGRYHKGVTSIALGHRFMWLLP